MTIINNNPATTAAYTSFEEYWASYERQKAAELAQKYGSVKAAFDALQSKEAIELLAKVLHPNQQVIRWEKSGSAQVTSTDGLPKWSDDRESYETVRCGTVYYFHPSTLKEGATVEYDGRIWRVLMNYLARGSAGSLAYQCLYLLEVAVLK